MRLPAALIRAAVEDFPQRGGPAVIVLSSWPGQCGSSNPRLGASGVERTPMSIDASEAHGGEHVATARLAMGERVPPHEIADLVTFLATGQCPHLSGATLDVNGARYVR